MIYRLPRTFSRFKCSAFKDIKRFSDIFKTKIDNDISHLSKLLEICNKEEELEIDYDLKNKLPKENNQFKLHLFHSVPLSISCN